MKTFKTTYTIHSHKQASKLHWDLRILSPRKATVWSFAIPKSRPPEKKERILAIQTEDHPVKWISFEGTLKNGDVITIVESYECDIVMFSKERMIIDFHGEKFQGKHLLLKMKDDKWLFSKT